MSSLELGVIGNCAIASLIDRKGRHVWHGIGRLDGDPVFNGLLGGDDPQGGFMDVVVAGAKDVGRRLAQADRIRRVVLVARGIRGRDDGGNAPDVRLRLIQRHARLTAGVRRVAAAAATQGVL